MSLGEWILVLDIDYDFLVEKGFSGLAGFLDMVDDIVNRVEKVLGHRVYILFTGDYRDIDDTVIDYLYRYLETPVDGDLGIILYSNGGISDQAYLIGRFLQENTGGRLRFIIPRRAKSAATTLACSGDELIMTSIAELGPIDPTIFVSISHRYVPVLSIIEVFKTIPQLGLPENIVRELLNKLPVMEIGDYKRILEHVVELTSTLLSRRMFRGEPDKAYEIASKLASYKFHGASITYYDAVEIGLKTIKATSEFEKLLVQLHTLYRERVLELERDLLEGVEEETQIILKNNRGVLFTRDFLNISTA